MKSLKSNPLFLPVFFFLVLVALTAWHPVVDHDFGFHVAAGKEILSTGRVPDTDHLSVAGEGKPWINRLWGFQVLLYFFYKNLGFTGVSFLTSLLACATFSLLLLSVRKPGSPSFLIIFLLALFIVQGRLRERPEALSFFFLACVYYLLESHMEENPRRPRAVFLIPAVQLLWVNAHGLFILGVMLQIFLFISWEMERAIHGFFCFQMTHPTARKKRELLSIIFLSVLASFINPFGLKGALVPFEQYSMMGGGSFFSNITELVPTHQLLPGLWRADKLYLAVLVVFFFLAGAPFFRSGARISLYHLMVFLAFLFLAMKANRNLALFALAAAPFAGASLSTKTAGKDMPPYYWSHAVSFLLFVLVLLRAMNLLSGVLFVYPLGTGLYPPEKFATRPVDFMLENNIRGPVFPTDLRDGNLLLWKGIKPVYDGRLEIFGEDFFRQYHQKTITSREDFESALDNYGANAVLVRRLMDNRYPAIAVCIPKRAQDLYENPGWALVYMDGSFCIFIRNGQRQVDGRSKEEAS
ncbi:MAG: hypothetical protein HZA01_16195 [Nitrospinae bacterium]|nr:hypothetical protein [Nitrospinota bacterium]